MTDATTSVYLLRSAADRTQTYVGSTHNLTARVAAHNRGSSSHTAKYAPWNVVVTVEFADEEGAIAFERYLKTGSGRAFANRHFWSGKAR